MILIKLELDPKIYLDLDLKTNHTIKVKSWLFQKKKKKVKPWSVLFEEVRT